MAEKQFCTWCLKSKNKQSRGNNYCIVCKRFLCHGCAESHLIRDSSHRVLDAAKVRFCDKCSHVNACAFCWDCKLYFCDICSAKHTSADNTNTHSLEYHEWTMDDKPEREGASQTAVIGISGQGQTRDQTEQACASNTESEMDRLVYSDYTGPDPTPSQPSDESPNELPDQLPQDTPPERPPKPTAASTTGTSYRRRQVYLTSEGYDSSEGMAPDDDHAYDYIETGDITIGAADDKIGISHMHALPRGGIVLYEESKKQLMLYDAELTTYKSSHQMQSRVLDICIVSMGTDDRIYVVLYEACSKSSEIIHFVIDNASSTFQTKGSKTIDYESSGLTGYDRGIAVVQNMRKGRILLHLYNKDYSEDKVWPFDFRLSLTDKFGNKHGPDLRYSLSTAGRGKLVIIADCKYNFVSIVDVERGHQILKYDHASLACPSQIATYQDNIVFILCKESGNVHALAITGSANQRRELTNLDTLNLREWSPGAMCCCSATDRLYISHSQIGRVRPYKLSDLKLQ